jgi:hypothetical protein
VNTVRKLVFIAALATIGTTGCNVPTATVKEAVHLAETEFRGAFDGCYDTWKRTAPINDLYDLYVLYDHWNYCGYHARQSEDAALARVGYYAPHEIRVRIAETVLTNCAKHPRQEQPTACMDWKRDDANALVTAQEAVEAAQKSCADRGGPGEAHCMYTVRIPAFLNKIHDLGFAGDRSFGSEFVPEEMKSYMDDRDETY